MHSSTGNEIILVGGHVGERVTEYLASRANGEIGIVTFAQAETDPNYIREKGEIFAKYNTKVRHIVSEDDLGGLSLIYYAGGDQNLLFKRLKESALHIKLLDAWRKRQIILAGSSAGAMVMCGVMLEEGRDEVFGRIGIELTNGLGPLRACFVVPHWCEWSTAHWRGKLIDRHGEDYYIFGIDENTAVVWQDGKCRVVGAGRVHVRGRMTGDWGNGEEFEIART